MALHALVKFEALLTLKTEEEGGRRTPIENGFRADLRYDESQLRFAAFEFDEDILFPGNDKLIVCHILLHSEQEIDHILNRVTLDVVEGPHVIGSVLVKNVIEREEVRWKKPRAKG